MPFLVHIPEVNFFSLFFGLVEVNFVVALIVIDSFG